MPDRPIIFSAPMVRALLEGRKSQTRRAAWRTRATAKNPEPVLMPSPWQKVKPGDRLWVRESAWVPPHPDEISERGARDGADTWEPDYLADGPVSDGYRYSYRQWGWNLRPSIHMPRWASRLTLLVTAVKVERLQEISEGDARAEGVLWVPGHGDITPADLHEGYSNYLCCRQGFEVLWDSIHGPGAWDANPWVCAITFTVHKANIDALPREAA